MKAALGTGLSLALALIACGPSRLASLPGDDDDDDTGDESSTSAVPDLPSADADTTGGTDTSGTSTTIIFVPDPDTPSWNECDPFEQDCPGGEKCVPYASTGGNWDANKCVPIMGDQATGEPCTYGGTLEATDDCDESGACWNVMDVDGELIGTCHAFCTGTPDTPECPSGSQCPISGNGSLGLCIPTCDPIAQDCDPGLACYWAINDFQCIFTTQDIPAGEPCGFINDCAAGLTCVNAEVFPACEGAACCSAFCELGLGDAQCDAVPGTSCVAFFEDGQAPPGYELVGVCIVAP